MKTQKRGGEGGGSRWPWGGNTFSKTFNNWIVDLIIL